MLNKGDQCYVMLYSGEIVKAEYCRHASDCNHFVILSSGKKAIAGKVITEDETAGVIDCRFVCMTGLNKGEQ